MILKKLGLVSLFLSLILNLYAQNNEIVEKIGNVSYKSSQNIYVQFDETDGIIAGDTLYSKVKQKLIPAVKVNFISTRSCAGTPLKSENLKTGDQLFAYVLKKQKEEKVEEDSSSLADAKLQNLPDPVIVKKNNVTVNKSKSDGRISVQSYSSISSGSADQEDQRWRYTFSYYAENIGESNFSFSSYFNYSYRAADWKTIQKQPWDNLKVYDLSIGFNFDDETSIKAGRYLNPKISSLSSVDGLQFQKKFSNYFGGVIIGTRPDFSTLGFNSKLFEYGGYFGRTDTIDNKLMESTVGFFQQTNNSKIDRRFVYFQHSNSLINKLNLFLSSEVDLYSIEKGKISNKPSLTSLFILSNYSPIRAVSFSISYDARKNVIYYETFKNTIDSIIENETRQGLRVSSNVRLFNKLFAGLSAGYRFLKKDIKPSRNYNGYLTYTQLPLLEISPSMSYSHLISNYIDGSVYGIRISKYITAVDYSISFAYSKVEYDYLSSTSKLKQNNFMVDISGKILGQLYLYCSYEGVFEHNLNYSRFLFDISLRF